MKQKLISLLLTSALLTSVCGALAGCDIANFGKKEHGVNDHDWEFQEVVKEKTCTQNGVISYSCSCGESKTKIQQSDGHQCDEWSTLTAPTCQQEGVRQGFCKVCEETVSENIPAVSHQYVNGVCKWCNTQKNTNQETIGSSTSQNNNNNNDPAPEGMVFLSNGDGTCALQTVYSFEHNTVEIPSTVNGETVTGILSSAFLTCTTLEFISIPATVTEISDYAFNYCYDLFSIKVDPKNPVFYSDNGILYDKAQTTLICYPAQISNSGFVLPRSVTTIGEYAFYENTYLIRLCVYSNLKTIRMGAFGSAYRLSEVYYEGGESQWSSVSIGSLNNGIEYVDVFYNTDPDCFYDLAW